MHLGGQVVWPSYIISQSGIILLDKISFTLCNSPEHQPDRSYPEFNFIRVTKPISSVADGKLSKLVEYIISPHLQRVDEIGPLVAHGMNCLG